MDEFQAALDAAVEHDSVLDGPADDA